jgi:iron complex outermembrane receptor protein
MGIEYFTEKAAFKTFETLANGTSGIQLSDQEEKRSYLNGFIQSELSLNDKWIIFAGIHATKNKLSNDELLTDLKPSVYPTTGFNYEVANQISFSASISRGYSNLSLDDLLNSSGMITPGIKPETGWSKELSLSIGDMTINHARIGIYHMNIENSINTIRIADDVFEKVNSGKSIHQGVEIEYDLHSKNQLINLEGAYSFTHHRFNEHDNHRRLPGTPNHIAYNRFILVPIQSFEISISHHLVSEVFLDDANTVLADGYNLFNGGISYEWRLKEKLNMTFSANVHNLFDTRYASMYQINAPSAGGALPRYYYPGKPRSFYTAIQFQYGL